MNRPIINADLDPIFDRLAALTGLITPALGETLAALAARIPAEQAIVELGSYKGKSTCYLAAGASLGHGAHVYAFDAWDLPGNESGRFGFAEKSTKRAFREQVASMGFKEAITPTCQFGAVAAAQWEGPPVGLLYIDADHRAKSVRADFNAWLPRLAPDAFVAFDDYDTPRNPGVKEVVDRFAADGLIIDVRIAAERLAIARLP